MERPPRPTTPTTFQAPSRPRTPHALHTPAGISLRRVSSSLNRGSGSSSTATIARSFPSHSPDDRSMAGTPVSSSSSVSGLESSDGGIILVTGPDTDADLMDAEGEVKAADGDTNQALRESLRHSLTRKEVKDIGQRARRKSLIIHDISHKEEAIYAPRQYFVITHAGKPVFMSRKGSSGSAQDELVNAMGIIQALISVFADDDDKIRCINAGSTRITFLLRAPLYYVCVSSWGEPESVTRLHLEYLHLQILSVLTGSQLSKIFERRTNFDLRRLLDGSETFLKSLINRMEFDMGIITASLNALRIDPTIRSKAADSLLPSKDIKDLLYVLLVVGTRVVTLLRPKKHSVHPSDLHLLINTLSSSSLSSSAATSSWLPICLPKFNPNGFLHVYLTFLSQPGVSTPPTHDSPSSSGGSVLSDTVGRNNSDHVLPPASNFQNERGTNRPTEGSSTLLSRTCGDSRIGLAIVTAERDGFDKLREWAEAITETLASQGVLGAILSSSRMHDYASSELGIPGLRHFVYKSRTHVQITSPVWEEPYDNLDDRRRLVTLYQILHDAMHARSAQAGGPLKLQYIRTELESVLCWVTTPFELFVTLSPRVPKSAAVGAANAVTKWVKKEEARLFLRDAPVF